MALGQPVSGFPGSPSRRLTPARSPLDGTVIIRPEAFEAANRLAEALVASNLQGVPSAAPRQGSEHATPCRDPPPPWGPLDDVFMPGQRPQLLDPRNGGWADFSLPISASLCCCARQCSRWNRCFILMQESPHLLSCRRCINNKRETLVVACRSREDHMWDGGGRMAFAPI